MDLEAYRAEAEAFTEELAREFYLQGAGHKEKLEIEPIYARHASLFDRATVEELRELGAAASGDGGRRLRQLLGFAFDGLLGRETRELAEELAWLEATLEVAGPEGPVPFRSVPVVQANEPDPERREALERARDELLESRMNPLYRDALEREHQLARDLGWPSYAGAYAELRGVDLEGLAVEAGRFLAASEGAYEPSLGPLLERAGMPPLGELRRSDLARLFRAPELDALYPAGSLVESLAATLAGLGIELEGQASVRLDTDPRPAKSPRAFCSPVRVPEEVYLVIAPVGGREDYAAFFHEGGHAEHYANVDARLAFEFRHLGDNSVTESFAFLFEHLTYDPTWLREHLGVEDPAPAVEHTRGSRLYFIRRYAAKLAYELELHAPDPPLAALPDRYAELLGAATRVRWTRASWLADVDPGFYVACYLRAWALEAIWWQALRERYGERWYASPAAGTFLRELWQGGQRLDAAELCAEAAGAELGFAALAGSLGLEAAA